MRRAAGGSTGPKRIAHLQNHKNSDQEMNQVNPENKLLESQFLGRVSVVAFLWLLGAYSLPLMLESSVVNQLALEDGVVESIGAVGFFAASVLFFVLFHKSRFQQRAPYNPLKGNVFYMLLGLAFLFVGMEEISWGQRIIGFQTPEGLAEVNAQREFNFHNLEIFHGETESGERKSFWALLLNMDRLFSLFWLSFCCLIPLLYRFSARARYLLDSIGMPIVSLVMGLLFILNYVFSKILEQYPGGDVHHAVVEIKEMNIAVLFVALAITFLCARKDDVSS